MRFSTALIFISAAVCASAAPISHGATHSGSEVVHHAVHTHDLSHAPHTHEDTLELVHTGASEDLHSRSIDHMNELEARSKTGKKSHKGKHHGKKHHKKGGKKHHKHGKHGKHHKKHSKMQAQA